MDSISYIYMVMYAGLMQLQHTHTHTYYITDPLHNYEMLYYMSRPPIGPCKAPIAIKHVESFKHCDMA